MSQLSLFVIRLHPWLALNDGKDLCAGADQLPNPNLPFAHDAVHRRNNAGVRQIRLCNFQPGMFRAQIGARL
jgi:hypothetical protein